MVKQLLYLFLIGIVFLAGCISQSSSKLKAIDTILGSNSALESLLDRLEIYESKASVMEFFGLSEDASITELEERVKIFDTLNNKRALRQLVDVDTDALKNSINNYEDLEKLLKGTALISRQVPIIAEQYGKETHKELVKILIRLAEVTDEKTAEKIVYNLAINKDLEEIKKEIGVQ